MVPAAKFVAVVAVVAEVAVFAVQAAHVPVRLVMTPDAGVPSTGATSVAPVGKTRLGSSEITGVVVPDATSI